MINPRPRDEAAIFHAFADQTIGLITYSEGCNDDVNKIVWSALGWDPGADVLDVLRRYGRYLVGCRDRDADGFAHGTARARAELARAALDQWLGRYDAPAVPRLWSAGPSPAVLANWRFQQALYRAYYDAYVRSRLIYETDLEEQALAPAAQARRDRLDRWRWTRPRRILNRAVTAAGCGAISGAGSSSWPRRSFRASACSSACPRTRRSRSAGAQRSTPSTMP